MVRRKSLEDQKSTVPRNPDSLGSSGDGVVAVLDRLRNATAVELAGLTEVHGATQTDRWARARRAAWDVAWMSGRESMEDLAVEEVWLVSTIVGMDNVSEPAVGAAEAAVVYDLIGQHGYTREHHRTLTGPWRSVMGIYNGTTWLHRVA